MAEKLPPKKRGRKPILDPELVAAALAELQGNIAAVAKRFGVDRSAVRQLVDRRPALRRVLADAREGMKDNAESALFRAVLAGEAWAVCFFLKCQAKDRGYVERHEHRHDSGTLGDEVRERLREVDGPDGGQPGQTRGAQPAGVADAPAPAGD